MKRETVKKFLPVVELVVAAGVTIVCDSVLKEHVPEQDKKVKKILAGVGSWAISNYVGTKVTDHILGQAESKIDQTFDTIDEAKEAIKEIKKMKNGEA